MPKKRAANDGIKGTNDTESTGKEQKHEMAQLKNELETVKKKLKEKEKVIKDMLEKCEDATSKITDNTVEEDMHFNGHSGLCKEAEEHCWSLSTDPAEWVEDDRSEFVGIHTIHITE